MCHSVGWGMRMRLPTVMRSAIRRHYVAVQEVGVRLPWPSRARSPQAWEIERDEYLAERLREIGEAGMDPTDRLGESEAS